MSRRRHILQMINDASKVRISIGKTFRSIKTTNKLIKPLVYARFNDPHPSAGFLVISVIEIPTEKSSPKASVSLLSVGLRHVPGLKRREAQFVSIDTVVVVPHGDKRQLLM